MKNMTTSGYRRLKLAIGVFIAVSAAVAATVIMLGSYSEWKNYYDDMVAEKEHNKYLQSLPLTLESISAELAEGVVYYDNDTAEPIASDIVVMANFSEKGRDFSRKLNVDDYTISVPENFSKSGGAITVSYTWQPEQSQDAGEGEPLPETVTKTTEVQVTLVQPDETVFKVIEAPTYTSGGMAENINGEQRPLPVLNDVNYQYTEYVTEKVARFVYPELNLMITKPVTQKVTYRVTSGSANVELNNVDCHFLADIPDATISFSEEEQTFVLAAEAGKTVDIYLLSADNVIIGGEGQIVLHSTLKTNRVTVKSGASLRIQDAGTAINAAELNFEEGSYVECLTSQNGIIVSGSGKLFGTFIIKDQTGSNSKTGIEISEPDVTLELGKSSSVILESYTYAIGNFGNDANDKVMLPYGAQRTENADLDESLGEIASWYVIAADGSRHTVLSLRKVVNDYFCNVSTGMAEYSSPYTIVKQPTIDEGGLATADGLPDVQLPALSDTSAYIFTENDDGSVGFTHFASGVVFTVNVSGERITIGNKVYNSLTAALFLDIEGLAISYDEQTATYSMKAEGEAVIDGGISTKNLVFESGTFGINGVVGADVMLTVMGGATVTIEASTAIIAGGVDLREGSSVICYTSANGILLKGNAKFMGALLIEDLHSADKTGIEVRANSAVIELGRTSRVTIKSFTYAIGKFDGNYDNNSKILFPVGTFLTPAADRPEGELASWFVIDDSGAESKVLTFVNVNGSFCNVGTEIPEIEGNYTVTKTPSLTESGTATFEDGGEMVLPALSKKVYSISEDKETSVLTFTHYATGITFTVTPEQSELITVNGVTYNYLTAALLLKTEQLTVSYEDGAYIMNAQGEAVIEGGISTKNLVFESGTYIINGAVGADVMLTVMGGATVTIEASTAIMAGGIDLRAGSAVTCHTSANGILLKGNAKFMGTLLVEDLNSADKTGLEVMANSITIELGRTSRVTFKSFTYAIGKFYTNYDNNSKLLFPEGTYATPETDLAEGELASWFVIDDEGARAKVLTLVNVNNFIANAKYEIPEIVSDYSVTKTPTLTESGTAENSLGEIVTLPALDGYNYGFTIGENTVTFIHYATGATFTVTAENDSFTLGGTKYNSLTAKLMLGSQGVDVNYADGVYTFSVAAGKTYTAAGLTANNFTLAGEGTLKINGKLTATGTLSVSAGATLEITASGAVLEAGMLKFAAGSTVNCYPGGGSDPILVHGDCELLGTLYVQDTSGSALKTAIVAKVEGITITLGTESRIKIESFAIAFGDFTWHNATLIAPAGTQHSSGEFVWTLDGENIIELVETKTLCNGVSYQVAEQQ